MIEAMSEENEFSIFLSSEQKRNIVLSLFSAYYQEQIANQQVIFDTNRLWCSKLPLVCDLFPDAKVICCVRNIAWIMDSLEQLTRKNTLDVSRLFNNRAETATVYSRTETLMQGNRLVGFAYNALKEAFYSQHADRLLFIEYDLLTQDPEQILTLIYQFIGEEFFPHDFDNVEYSEPEFDRQLRTEGLHTVRSKVEYQPRRTILPPDLFERFSQLSFWSDTTNSLANMISVHPTQLGSKFEPEN